MVNKQSLLSWCLGHWEEKHTRDEHGIMLLGSKIRSEVGKGIHSLQEEFHGNSFVVTFFFFLKYASSFFFFFCSEIYQLISIDI